MHITVDRGILFSVERDSIRKRKTITASIYTICAKFDITANKFADMYDVFTLENGNDLFNSLSIEDKELYWQMYDAMEQYHELLNPRPVVAAQPPRRRSAKRAA